MPMCQPQLKSTERRSRAVAAGVYGGAPPRPRPPPPPPGCPAPAGPGPPCRGAAGCAPPPAPCALAVSGAASPNATPSARVVRIIPCRDAISRLLSSVGYELDFFLVLQHDRSQEPDGGAIERGI